MNSQKLEEAAKKIAKRAKIDRFSKDPMHDRVSIALNAEPTYLETQNMLYFLNLIQEAGYDIVEKSSAK